MQEVFLKTQQQDELKNLPKSGQLLEKQPPAFLICFVNYLFLETALLYAACLF